ncbi:MAG: hypothetical protein HYZ42_04970 [Bacteroidetes bacterium]|nr:hypothetical protein [Bacteroidota bacterium]
MRKYFLFLFVLGSLSASYAQSVSMNGFGFTLGPSYGNRFTKNRNDNQVTPFPGYKVGYKKLKIIVLI